MSQELLKGIFTLFWRLPQKTDTAFHNRSKSFMSVTLQKTMKQFKMRTYLRLLKVNQENLKTAARDQ